MRGPYRVGVSVAILAICSAGLGDCCSADESPPPSPRSIRKMNIANTVSPRVTAMGRAETLSMAYYQSLILERAEARKQRRLQPGLFAKKSMEHQQHSLQCKQAHNYVCEYFGYIRGNGAAVWDHRP